MPVTVTSRRNHQRPSVSAERLERFAGAGRCVTDQFVACKIGGMLLLKLLGFMQDERAELLAVSDSEVTLTLGQPWYRRWGRGADRRRPVSVRIRFAEPGDDLAAWQQAAARRSVVAVELRALCASHRTADFHRRADAILQRLRLHFVAD